MVKHNGYRTKTRRRFRKNPRTRGLPGLSKFMIEYTIGDSVDIVGDPTFVKFGFPHRRFDGKTGVITGLRGKCYEIELRIGDATKMIIAGKEHIRLNQGYLNRKAVREAQA
jgi:large subunit ribosomal protein L21e